MLHYRAETFSLKICSWKVAMPGPGAEEQEACWGSRPGRSERFVAACRIQRQASPLALAGAPVAPAGGHRPERRREEDARLPRSI